MNRRDLQKLAALREKEAKALFAARQYCGAYYLAGYSVECALKSCIAKLTKRHDFPDKHFAKEAWSHEPEKLLKWAGLAEELSKARKRNVSLDANWALVKDWREESRYDHTISRKKAADFLTAIFDNKDGVLQWLKLHW